MGGYDHRTASGDLRFRVTRFDEMDALSSRNLPGTGKGSITPEASGRIELVHWGDGRLTWRAERTSGVLTHTRVLPILGWVKGPKPNRLRSFVESSIDRRGPIEMAAPLGADGLVAVSYCPR